MTKQIWNGRKWNTQNFKYESKFWFRRHGRGGFGTSYPLNNVYGPLFAYGVFIDTLFLWTLDVLLKPLDTAVDSRQLQVMLFVIKTTRHDKLLASWPHPNIYLCVYNKHQSGHSPNMVVTLCCSENSSQSVTLALFHLAKTRLKVKQKHSVENSISILDFKKHHFDCYTSSGTIIVC